MFDDTKIREAYEAFNPEGLLASCDMLELKLKQSERDLNTLLKLKLQLSRDTKQEAMEVMGAMVEFSVDHDNIQCVHLLIQQIISTWERTQV